MQNTIRLTLGITVLLAGLLQAVSVRAQEAAAPAVPDPDVILLLVRSTLTGLDHANRTGNYTVLRDLGGPDFRNTHTSASLAVAFTNVRQRLDMSIAALLDPEFTEQPIIDENGLLWIRGFLPTQPMVIGFELVYQQIGSAWGLSGLAIHPGQKGPPKADNAQDGAANPQDNGAVPTPRDRPSE